MLETVKEWLVSVALKKLVKGGVMFALSWAVAHKAPDYGVSFDQEKVLAGSYLALDQLRNYVKVKFGLAWL